MKEYNNYGYKWCPDKSKHASLTAKEIIKMCYILK